MNATTRGELLPGVILMDGIIRANPARSLGLLFPFIGCNVPFCLSWSQA